MLHGQRARKIHLLQKNKRQIQGNKDNDAAGDKQSLKTKAGVNFFFFKPMVGFLNQTYVCPLVFGL